MGRKLDLEQLKATLEQTDDDRVYFRVGKFDVRIKHEDEGIVIDVFPWDEEGFYTGDSLGSTYVFDAEADEAMEPDPDAKWDAENGQGPTATK